MLFLYTNVDEAYITRRHASRTTHAVGHNNPVADRVAWLRHRNTPVPCALSQAVVNNETNEITMSVNYCLRSNFESLIYELCFSHGYPRLFVSERLSQTVRL